MPGSAALRLPSSRTRQGMHLVHGRSQSLPTYGFRNGPGTCHLNWHEADVDVFDRAFCTFQFVQMVFATRFSWPISTPFEMSLCSHHKRSELEGSAMKQTLYATACTGVLQCWAALHSKNPSCAHKMQGLVCMQPSWWHSPTRPGLAAKVASPAPAQALIPMRCSRSLRRLSRTLRCVLG